MDDLGRTKLSLAVGLGPPLVAAAGVLFINAVYGSDTQRGPDWASEVIGALVVLSILGSVGSVVLAKGWRLAAAMLGAIITGIVVYLSAMVAISLEHAFT